MTHLVQVLGKLIVRVQCKGHQQMIGWSGNLGRIGKSEKVSFQLVTERKYPMKTNENQTNGALWAWVLEKVWKIDTKVLQKK